MKISKPYKGLFKKGDIVGIIDGSYMTTLVEEEIKHSSLKIPIIGHNRDLWKILNIGGNFPSPHEFCSNGKPIKNIYKIKNLENGEIWYCSDINIKLENEWRELLNFRKKLNLMSFDYQNNIL